MSKKAKPIKVLYIEDDKKAYDTLQTAANEYRILLTHTTNLEDGRNVFIEKGEDKFFDAIILDAVCLVRKDDNTPTKGHITKAINDFNQLAPGLLKVVYTGEPAFAKTLEELHKETGLKIFNKGNMDETLEMLQMIVDASRNKEDNIIASKYPDVFEVFEKGYLDNEAKDELLRCIKDMKSENYTTIKNSLGCLRRLQEKIYIALNKIDPEIVPDRFMVADNLVGSKVQVRGIYKHLTEQKYVKRHSIIDTYASTIYSITSDNGAHSPYENPHYPPTKYTVQAMTFAMMDMILWFKSFYEILRVL